MDLKDVKRKRQKKQMPFGEARQAALEQRAGEAVCKNRPNLLEAMHWRIPT
jgi:hypothetical protein